MPAQWGSTRASTVAREEGDGDAVAGNVVVDLGRVVGCGVVENDSVDAARASGAIFAKWE